MVNEVMILRGLPGCGKSYFVRELRRAGREVMVVSADDYLERHGTYRFHGEDLPEAHNVCFKRYLEAVTGRRYAADVLVVDNTNVKLWEFSPYVAVAKAVGVPFEIIHVRCPVKVAIERNIHRVPARSIERMARGFENAPPFWPSTTVDN
jgi:tRNA uridine 5-carbamoylmethylation protein Kti12